MSANGDKNEEFLAELRLAGLVIDPVPERVTAAAKGSLTWRTIDAELAELTYDSVLDDDRLSLVRGVAAVRLLTFTTPGLTVDVEVEATERDRRLIGELSPGQQATISIRHGEGITKVDTDEDGRFRTGPVPAGPISISLRLAAGGSTVQTEWITL